MSSNERKSDLRNLASLLALIGLVLLLVRFALDIMTQSRHSRLGLFDYYLPATLTVVCVVWTLYLIRRKRTLKIKNKILKGLTITLIGYMLIWQSIFLNFILTKNSSTLADYVSESFPVVVSIGCSITLLVMWIKNILSHQVK